MNIVTTSEVHKDLSTFDLRWAEALGAPNSMNVANFGVYAKSIAPLFTDDFNNLLAATLTTDPLNPQGMSFLDVGADSKFLFLTKRGRYMFIRPFFDFLYNQITERWSSNGDDHVLLEGNAGIGKSWFQVYALRRLLLGYGSEHKYLFVIRQVGKAFHLIDLSNAQIQLLDVKCDMGMFCLDLFNRERVLYFFEPLTDRLLLPLPVALPSLTTLSPYEERIHEYSKDRLSKLIFPSWTLDELSFVAEYDPLLSIGQEEVLSRFIQFGGIIRHVFALDELRTVFEQNQRTTILDANLTILRAKTTGIDSDPKEAGHNVSGYILSYCNVQTAGPGAFRSAQMDFTSDFVRSEIRKQFINYNIRSCIEIVLDCLNDKQLDLGGLHLQAVVTFLLSKGNKVDWQFKRVTIGGGGGNWSPFTTQKRKVIRSDAIHENVQAPYKILVPSNPGFPLVDIVLSNHKLAHNGTLQAFQVTWQPTHSFGLRALYDLRERRLRIPDTVLLQVFFVTPDNEGIYAAMSKENYLGDINQNLNYSKDTIISSARLHDMWRNTDICVLKPKSAWVDTLRRYRGPT